MNINYFGKVKLQIVNNGKIVKELNLHNTGTNDLFYKIAAMLENSSNNIYGNLKYIDVRTAYYDSSTSILTSKSNITTSVSQSPAAINVVSSVFKDQINSSAVQNSYHLCLLTDDEDAVLAYVQIQKSSTIDLIKENSPLLINWELVFNNGESD